MSPSQSEMPSRLLPLPAEAGLTAGPGARPTLRATGTIAPRLAAAGRAPLWSATETLPAPSRTGAVGARSAVLLLEARGRIASALRPGGWARRWATWSGTLRASWTRALRARAERRPAGWLTEPRLAECRFTEGWLVGPVREAWLPQSGWALAERLALRTGRATTAEPWSRVVAARWTVCATSGSRPSPSLGARFVTIKGLGARLVVSRVVGLDRAYL